MRKVSSTAAAFCRVFSSRLFSIKGILTVAIVVSVVIHVRYLSSDVVTTTAVGVDPADDFLGRHRPTMMSTTATISNLVTSGRHPTKHPLKLNVPFYVYDSSSPLYWQNYTFGQKQNGPAAAVAAAYEEFKHSDDLWLYRASTQHPQRTNDASKAKLFYVPLLLNAVAERRTCLHLQQDGRTRTKCFDRPGAAYRFADKCLANSTYFQHSQGNNHVLVASHWLDPPHKLPNLKRCNLINFEGRMPLPMQMIPHEEPSTKSFALPSFYVGQSCPFAAISSSSSITITARWEKTHDFALIATFKPGNPDFLDRQHICDWIRDIATSTNYSVSQCGPGPQCPALAQAKYGFHPRGDTWGSNRIMDCLLSRTIPLFTHPRQYDLLPPFIPWKDLSYLINVSTQAAFDESLQEILAKPESDYWSKRLLIEDYMHLFDHTQIYQFDAYMAEFANKLELQ